MKHDAKNDMKHNKAKKYKNMHDKIRYEHIYI